MGFFPLLIVHRTGQNYRINTIIIVHLATLSQTEIGPIRCEQSDTCLTQKKSHSPSFSSYKLKVTMKYLKKIKNTTKLSGFNDNYNLYNYNMIHILITPLHTSTFSLIVIIKHLF